MIKQGYNRLIQQTKNSKILKLLKNKFKRNTPIALLIVLNIILCFTYILIHFHKCNELDALIEVSLLPDEKLNLNDSTKNIFFIEPFCDNVFDNIKTCAVESAAKLNPSGKVVVMFICPENNKSVQNRTVTVLSKYKNVQLVNVNITTYTNYTSLEHFFTDARLAQSKYKEIHTAEVLRLLTLRKYGGVSLAFDMMVVHSLALLPDKFVAILTPKLRHWVFGFPRDEESKDFLDLAMKLYEDMYDPSVYDIGAASLTHMVNAYCGSSDILYTLVSQCSRTDFFILPKEAFYPKEYSGIENMFVDEKSNMLPAMAVHKGSLHNDVLYAEFAEVCCPNTYKLFLKDFVD